ncbi:hypothetical protein ACIBEA_44170 [Streptomyces sp. NPDC051555]|uniref:hypothetical protein n=1 Tax=Streptomyces sp. NPDC051555 TaxID=3365657 RepID=UPI0037A6AF5C
MTTAANDPWRGELVRELPSMLAVAAVTGLGIPAALAFFRGEVIAQASAGTWLAAGGILALGVPVLALLGWWGERTGRDRLDTWTVNAAAAIALVVLILLDGSWTIILSRFLN